MLRLSIILFALLRFPGCGGNEFDPAEYIQWVENSDHGLKVKKSIGSIDFILQYKPIDYVIVKQAGNGKADKNFMDNEKKQMEDMQYYTFSIAVTDVQADILKYKLGKPEEFEERINYYSSQMQNDLLLIDGKDTLKCLLFHYERNYGLAPFSNFLLAFENIKTAERNCDKTLIYDDAMLGSGQVKLTIKAEDIISIPNLKLE